MVGGNLSVASGISTVKALDYTAIDTTISDTATDVFVYDTRKDSDGGAWRKRTTHTSWYNETLGTATRGTRREFPAVAVIVAETTKVTIYDGDDPDLPMWMEFDAGEQTANGKMLQFWGTATTGVVSSVTMLNGEMVVGTNNGSSSGVYVGMTAVNFASDSAYYRRNASDQYIIIGNPISDRNVNQYGGYPTTGGLGGGNVNDVAMTVLPNAPIDDATGLPIPTIAVATESGVSVIRDNGNVVDLTQNSPYTVTNNVFFSDYGKLLYDTEDTSVVYEVDIPPSDIGYGAYNSTSNGRVIYPTGTHGGFSSGEIRLLGRNMGDGGKLITKGAFAFDANGASETINGLTLFDREESDPAKNSLVAFASTSYNTGWMHGDVEGAFLSDTDTTNMVGTELITNGTFDSDITGWITNPFNASYPGSVTWDSGTSTIKVANPYGTSLLCGIQQNLTNLIAGRQYVVTFDVATGSSGGQYIEVAGQDISYSAVGTYSVYFTPDSSSYGLAFGSRRPGYGIATYYDNISVKLAEEDRSVNNKGLQVFGTINKTAVATGADLVAYSGFSASNYLKQQYNSDLAPGTGAYSVSCWFKTGTSSGDQYIFDRNNAGGSNTSRNLLLIMNTSAGNANKFQWWHRDASGNTTDIHITDKTITDNVWHQVVALNDGSTYKVYVDGEVSSITSSVIRNIGNDNSPPMYVGIRHTLGSTYMTGSMALFRYSKSAPSPEQIKKMYEDEKHLFQENAKATLYGSSDAVTALAFDDDTNLLHVGTSSGRSDFQGLRRINNTTTAVTTAITAQNEFIIEQ